MTAAGERAIPSQMAKPPDKQDLDRELDFELEETFPASDPLDLATRGEFLSKTMLRDPETKTSGAVYVFADRAAAERWREDIRRRRGPDVEARIFEVNEEASKLTRG